jgi:hypothetical protein
MGAQAQDLVEREPFRAALGFGQALGQVGVLAQDAAEMGLGHGDQVAGDFPGGKPAQRLGAPFIEPAPHKISAPFCAGLRQILEARGAHGGPRSCSAWSGLIPKYGGKSSCAWRLAICPCSSCHVFSSV